PPVVGDADCAAEEAGGAGAELVVPPVAESPEAVTVGRLPRDHLDEHVPSSVHRRRLDVLVAPEHVVRVPLPLDLRQPVVVGGAEGGPDAALALVADEVQVHAAVGVTGDVAPAAPGPAAVGVVVGRVLPAGA